MYGTIARMRLVPGSEPTLKAHLEAMQAHRVSGHISTTLHRSDDDPRELWMFVVFESVEAYRANAESETQGLRYQRLRSILEADPEWHDGEVIAQYRSENG